MLGFIIISFLPDSLDSKTEFSTPQKKQYLLGHFFHVKLKEKQHFVSFVMTFVRRP